eukprot:UN29774
MACGSDPVTRTRAVYCQTTDIPVQTEDDEVCEGAGMTKPDTSQDCTPAACVPCDESDCNNNGTNPDTDNSDGCDACICNKGWIGDTCDTAVSWMYTPWSPAECPGCGPNADGNDTDQTRAASCQDSEGTVTDDSDCVSEDKESTSETCEYVQCGTWQTTAWTPESCPDSCGLDASEQTRTVTCENESGEIDESYCAEEKPDDTNSCSATEACDPCTCVNGTSTDDDDSDGCSACDCPDGYTGDLCAYHYSTGDWTPESCPTECNTEASQQTREVACVSDDETTADCTGLTAPSDNQTCDATRACVVCEAGSMSVGDAGATVSYNEFNEGETQAAKCTDTADKDYTGSYTLECGANASNEAEVTTVSGSCTEVTAEQEVVTIDYTFDGLTKETFESTKDDLLCTVCETLGETDCTKCSWGTVTFTTDSQRRKLADSVVAELEYLADN